MKHIKRSEFEVGMSVLFKVLDDEGEDFKEVWSLDIIGYIQVGWLILMSYGELPDHFPYFEYNKLNRTFLLIKGETIDEEDLKVYKTNSKGIHNEP